MSADGQEQDMAVLPIWELSTYFVSFVDLPREHGPATSVVRGEVCIFTGHLLLEKFSSSMFLTNASTEATDTHEDLKLHVPLQRALAIPFLGLDVQWNSSEVPRARRISDRYYL